MRAVRARGVRGGHDYPDGGAGVGGGQGVGRAGGARDVGAVGAGRVAALPLAGEDGRVAGPGAVRGGQGLADRRGVPVMPGGDVLTGGAGDDAGLGRGRDAGAGGVGRR